jgi:hypothetical protein
MIGFRNGFAGAIMGVLLLSMPSPASAMPIAPPAQPDGQVIQAASREWIKRRPGGVRMAPGGASTRYYRGGGAYYGGNRYYGGRRYYGGNYNRGPVYAYDWRRHGYRYRWNRPGYGYYHDGWWYSSPWWGAGAGLAAGAIIGSAVAGASAAPVYDNHVAWCSQRYRTYDPASDTYVGKGGRRYRCVGP